MFESKKKIQKAIINLGQATNLVSYAMPNTLSKGFNKPQSKATDLVYKASNLINKEPKQNILLSTLIKSFRFTVTEYPLSQADIMNMDNMRDLLLHYFASQRTKEIVKNDIVSKATQQV